MRLARLIRKELKHISIMFLFFLVWLGLGALLKKVVLTEYTISFYGFMKAILFTFVIAKIVIILDRLPFNRQFDNQPLYIDVICRSLIYTLGAMVLIWSEALLRFYAHTSSVKLAIATSMQPSETYRLLAITIWVLTAFIFYNIFATISLFIGREKLIQLFLTSRRSQLTSR